MDEVRYISRLDADFPEKLKNISDPPSGIYVKGRLPNENVKTVAIVGARNCSEYGKKLTAYFASQLAASGVQVISGLARGVDGIAQINAVRSGGSTWGILGCGVDVVYPESNRYIYEEAVKNGGLISEYAPSDPPLKPYFVQRNRLISALCDVLLVIEAREKSGTAITVRNALMQGKDIYAVPGRLTDPLSAGCNKLIAQGAGIALNPETILMALDRSLNEPVIATAKKKIFDDSGIKRERVKLEGDEKTVYGLLDLYPKDLDEIVSASGLTVSVALEALLNLRIKGIVSECAKNNYVRKML